MRKHFTLILNFTTVLLFAPIPALGDQMTFLLEGLTNDIKFRVQVVESPAQSDALPIRRLQIECLTNCTAFHNYSEEFSNTPLSLLRLEDNGNQVVSVWAGGTAYWIRVYQINKNGARKVLEEATKGPPQFLFDKANGSPFIVLDDLEKERPSSTYIVRGAIWKWSGTRYQLIGKPP